MIAPNLIQIVVVGAGLIGPRHAQHVNENPYCELFGIIDPSPATKQVAQNLHTEHFSSIEQMIVHCDANGLDYPKGAIVCTPNHTHVKVSAELASYGIHLLVEKPISLTIPEAKALKEYAASKNVRILVGHHRRFNPFILEAKNNLAKIGQVVAIQGSWTLRKPEEYYQVSPWRTATETGGGVLLINLIHDLDLLQYLLGPIDKIYAELLQKQRLQYPDVDEGAALTIRFKSGVLGTFICSDNVTSPFNFESGTGENPTVPLHSGLEGFYRIFGSQGTLSVPDLNLYHQGNHKCGSWLDPIVKEPLADIATVGELRPFDLQLSHFLEVIKGSSEPFCTVDDGISALMCIDAVMKSIELGAAVYLEDPKDVQPTPEASQD
ncbi:NAD(P)-binding protein [Suhomyces tanzawaensis NRRL Y-17324]|uniref:NAD(P)-binding protein n=1 Tax=Suhomyces tanzawaensis NRRL Y-17324 TaxID=984487 RepID=A0A1E4SRH2_9ASCO|nr:NAD(P)-binding protein [Suhomyces tanzawaensis NRRL Y-17324]ODV82101.1 NAD(P)-binding protein [Suhomyces tanzawaensis NRRL Y-17324]